MHKPLISYKHGLYNYIELRLLTSSCTERIHFVLKGLDYTPGSTLLIRDIGASSNSDPKGALICVTDSTEQDFTGQWLFPDGTVVPTGLAPINMRINNQQLYLNRRYASAVGPLGNYVCRVAIDGVIHSAAINITLGEFK